jgi:hypothetical protein
MLPDVLLTLPVDNPDFGRRRNADDVPGSHRRRGERGRTMSTAVQPAPAGSQQNPPGDRSSGSFLIRVWYEAREIDGSAPAFRGYIKNLHTGEERFVRDPATVSEQILRQMGNEPPAEVEGNEGTRHDH